MKFSRRWWDHHDEGFRKVVQAAFTVERLGRILGVYDRNIYRWNKIPEHHLKRIHELLGLHPSEVRPDLYEADGTRKKLIKAYVPRGGWGYNKRKLIADHRRRINALRSKKIEE